MIIHEPHQMHLVYSSQHELQQRFLDPIKNTISDGWNILVERGNLVHHTMTVLFFRIISFFCPSFALRCEALWGHIRAVYASMKEWGLRKKIEILKGENIYLQTLIERATRALPGLEQLTSERNRLVQENGELRAQVQKLAQQRDLALEAKTFFVKQCHNALQALEALQLQFNRLDDYQVLTRHLNQFHDLYLQIPQNPKDQSGMTQMALNTIIPCYKEHRKKLHELLQRAIERLPPNSFEVGCLQGILRLSEEEMGHLEQISQTLHLIDALRVTFTEYFSRASR
jgi:hypothetical protein